MSETFTARFNINATQTAAVQNLLSTGQYAAGYTYVKSLVDARFLIETDRIAKQ